MDAQPVQRTSALLVVLTIVVAAGCRMPWKPMQLSQRSLENTDPDYEGLLRAERAQEGPYADDFAEQQRVERRPGLDSARASISDTSFSDDVLEAEFAAAENELTSEQAALLRQQMELVSKLRQRSMQDGKSSLAQAAKQDDGPQEFNISDSVDPTLEDIEAMQRKLELAKAQAERDASGVVQALAERANEVTDLAAVPLSSMQNIATHGGLGQRAIDQRGIDQSARGHSLGGEQGPSGQIGQVAYESSTRDASAIRETTSDIRDVPVTSRHAARAGDLSWKEMVIDARQQLDDLLASAVSPEQRIELEKARRLLSLSVNDLPAAMEPITDLEKSMQEYYRYTIQGWTDATNPSGHPDFRKRAALALASQRRATRELAAASELSVDNASFCSVVNSYGDVERFEKYDFKAGDEVLLYCEVDNFVSKRLPNGKEHETNLRGTYKICDAQSGRPVDQQSLPANREVSETVRRDYFMVYRIWLPQSLAPGSYELKLDIEDLHGSKFGSETVEFRIVQ